MKKKNREKRNSVEEEPRKKKIEKEKVGTKLFIRSEVIF